MCYIRGKNKELKEWIRTVNIRDNYTCQICFGCRGYIRLRTHHIKDTFRYPELIFDVQNGITLCIACHNTVHNLGQKRTEETRKKLSVQKLGPLNPRYGKPGIMLGKKHSKETIEKIKIGKRKYDEQKKESDTQKIIKVK